MPKKGSLKNPRHVLNPEWKKIETWFQGAKNACGLWFFRGWEKPIQLLPILKGPQWKNKFPKGKKFPQVFKLRSRNLSYPL